MGLEGANAAAFVQEEQGLLVAVRARGGKRLLPVQRVQQRQALLAHQLDGVAVFAAFKHLQHHNVTVFGKLWAALEELERKQKNVLPTVEQAKELGEKLKLNPTSTVIAYYRWRKFWGIRGRQAAE